MPNLDELLRIAGGSGAGAPPSRHFQAACAARRSIPLPAGSWRVIVAAPLGALALDLTLAELRQALSGGAQEQLGRGPVTGWRSALFHLVDDTGLGQAPRQEAQVVRQALAELDTGVLLRAPPGCNTLGLDVEVVRGELQVRIELRREPWLPLMHPGLLAPRS